MRYELEVGGRRRQVVVTRAGDGFAVTVDGTTHHVDVARISGHTLSLIVDRVWPADTSITPDPSAGQLTVTGAPPTWTVSWPADGSDRKSTRLNSSHANI